MKLPLIVKAVDGEIYHVLQFDRGLAIAVNPRTLRIEELLLAEIRALNQKEYAEWKSEANETFTPSGEELTMPLKEEKVAKQPREGSSFSSPGSDSLIDQIAATLEAWQNRDFEGESAEQSLDSAWEMSKAAIRLTMQKNQNV